MNQAICWRVGSLRVLESLSSIGAKYCHLNKVKPKLFHKHMQELRAYKNGWIDTSFFAKEYLQLQKFSSLLDEPITLVTKLHPNAFFDELGPHEQLSFHTQINHKIPRFCPECLEVGYHSVMHEVPWLDKCFIHASKLEPIYRHAAGCPDYADLGCIDHLIQTWFDEGKSNYAFCDGLSIPRISNEEIAESAKKLIEPLNKASQILVSKTDSSVSIHHGSRGLRLITTIKSLGVNNEGLENLIEQRDFYSFSKRYACESELSKAICQIETENLSVILAGRICFCLAGNAVPPWLSLLGQMQSKLPKGHRQCIARYLPDTFYLYQRMQQWNVPTYLDKPYTDLPCRRFELVFCLQILLGLQVRTFAQRHNSAYLLDLLRQTNTAPTPLCELTRVHLRHSKYFMPWDAAHDDRQGDIYSIPKPLGVFVDIVDDILFAWVHCWIWALKKAEITNRDHWIDIYLGRYVQDTEPCIVLGVVDGGITMHISSYAPFSPPVWNSFCPMAGPQRK